MPDPYLDKAIREISGKEKPKESPPSTLLEIAYKTNPALARRIDIRPTALAQPSERYAGYDVYRGASSLDFEKEAADSQSTWDATKNLFSGAFKNMGAATLRSVGSTTQLLFGDAKRMVTGEVEEPDNNMYEFGKMLNETAEGIMNAVKVENPLFDDDSGWNWKELGQEMGSVVGDVGSMMASAWLGGGLLSGAARLAKLNNLSQSAFQLGAKAGGLTASFGQANMQALEAGKQVYERILRDTNDEDYAKRTGFDAQQKAFFYTLFPTIGINYFHINNFVGKSFHNRLQIPKKFNFVQNAKSFVPKKIHGVAKNKWVKKGGEWVKSGVAEGVQEIAEESVVIKARDEIYVREGFQPDEDILQGILKMMIY